MCTSSTCFSLAISSWSRVAASPLKESTKEGTMWPWLVRNNVTGSEGTDPAVALALPEGLITVKGCSLLSLSFCSKFFTFSSSFSLSDSSDFTTDCSVFAEAFSPRSTVIWKSCLTTLGPSSTKARALEARADQPPNHLPGVTWLSTGSWRCWGLTLPRERKIISQHTKPLAAT